MPTKSSERWIHDGDNVKSALEKLGYKVDLQYAENDIPTQINQIENQITRGAKLLIIASIDGTAITTQLQEAADKKIPVIAYDRLIRNSPNVDYYATFDNFKVGVQQATSLLKGLGVDGGKKGPFNVELFGGSPDDNNATFFWNGAMSVLQPKIDDGTLKVVSNQTAFKQVTTQGWLAQNAQSRMDTLLAGFYTSAELDGVLSPNDTLARAILQSINTAGKPYPIVTGQDSEAESVKSIMAGIQYSTINKDTRKLVAEAIKMVGELQKGKPVDVNDPTSYNNGAKVVPTFLLTPQLVTRENAAESYRSDPTLEPLTRG